MTFHWYWPFVRPEEIDWARATVRPNESVLIQAIDRPDAPPAGIDGPISIVRSLPDVDMSVHRGVAWMMSRQRTYRARARARRDLWSSSSFDLVHLHYVNRFTDSVSRLPHPLVISVHDVTPHVPRLGSNLDQGLLTRVYRRADALIVHHSSIADELTRQTRIPNDRIHIVPHQVYPTHAPYVDPPEGPPVILFFGSLRQNKGLHLLGPMMDQLGDTDYRLVIAGSGEPTMQNAARALARQNSRIDVELGFANLERKRELFAQASVVVLPYTSFSSQSGVLHDAYGHGRPVVVTDVGALGATVRDDRTGTVVAPQDPVGLATAIRSVLDPHSWGELSTAARRVAFERSPQRLGVMLRAIYDTVLV